jgi:hypothetical protein
LFLDSSGDNVVSALDALLVINYLNAGGSGEGEPFDDSQPTTLDSTAASEDSRSDFSFWDSALATVLDDICERTLKKSRA